jgi:hypothetical protein
LDIDSLSERIFICFELDFLSFLFFLCCIRSSNCCDFWLIS